MGTSNGPRDVSAEKHIFLMMMMMIMMMMMMMMMNLLLIERYDSFNDRIFIKIMGRQKSPINK